MKMEIIKDVIITYTDGKKDFFKAINISNKGIFTGRIMENNKFIDVGFIPKINIKFITVNNKIISDYR